MLPGQPWHGGALHSSHTLFVAVAYVKMIVSQKYGTGKVDLKVRGWVGGFPAAEEEECS